MRLQRYRKSTPNGVDFLIKYVGLLLISSIFCLMSLNLTGSFLFAQWDNGKTESLVAIMNAVFLQRPCAPRVLAAYTHVLAIEEEIGVF